MDNCIDRDSLLALGEFQDYQGWVSILELEAYAPMFDQDQLAIYLTTPAAAREGQMIELLPRLYPNLDHAKDPECFSAYMNTFNQFTYDMEEANYRLDLEGAMRWDPWVLEGSAYVDPRNEESFDYSNVRLVRDWPDCPSRLVIGETRSLFPRLLSSDSLQGVRYSTDFDLQPYTVTEPISEYRFLLERDSNVEIWVNGRPFRTLRLRAGPYDMRNFPLTLGYNNIELRITDDLGRFQQLTFDAIRGPNLLAPGRCDRSMAMGVEGSGSSYGGQWIVAGSYREGLSETFTMSVEARADKNHQAAAVGADFATSYFFGRADMGVTHTDWGIGGAFQGVISRYLRYVNLSYRFDYYEEAFLAQGQDWEDSRVKSVHEVSLIAPSLCGTGSWRFDSTWISRWRGDTEQRQEISWNYTWNSRWSARAIASRTSYPEEEYTGLLQITYNFRNEDYRFHSDVQFENRDIRTYTNVGSNPYRGNLNWQLYHTHQKPRDGDHTDTLRGTLLYEHWRFHAYYAGELGDFGELNNQRHALNLNSAIAYAGGRWAITEPITDSFAIAYPDEKLEGLSLIGSCGDLQCRGSQDWPLVIPNLLSYYPAYVRIDAEQEDIFIDSDPHLLLPQYKSGFLIEVSNEEGEGGMHAASGTLYDEWGEALSFQVLHIQNMSRPDLEPFVSFTNEEGQFRIGGLNPEDEYRIHVGHGQFVQGRSPYFLFALPQTDGVLSEVVLGDLLPEEAIVRERPATRRTPQRMSPLCLELWTRNIAKRSQRPVLAPMRSSLIRSLTPKELEPATDVSALWIEIFEKAPRYPAHLRLSPVQNTLPPRGWGHLIDDLHRFEKKSELTQVPWRRALPKRHTWRVHTPLPTSLIHLWKSLDRQESRLPTLAPRRPFPRGVTPTGAEGASSQARPGAERLQGQLRALPKRVRSRAPYR
jgi:outer membrane usher protein